MADLVLDIGESAGLIWRFLNDRGPTTMGQLKRGTKLDETRLHQALGWLAREDKICIEKKKGGQSVALK